MWIDPTLWPKLHGAATHFPVALTFCATFLDGLAFVWPGASPRKSQLRAAGYWTVILGALGTFPAVISGLVLARGEAWGQGALLRHHLFVWPAFALLVGLGFWRGVVNDQSSRRGFAAYLAVLFLTAALMAAAGFWGGELLLNS